MYEFINAAAAAGKIPDGFVIVREMGVNHPTNPTVGGALCMNINTGIYGIIACGTISSVPQGWAKRMVDIDVVYVNHIQAMREKAGLIRPELVKLSGVPLRTLENWELGSRIPRDVYVLAKVAKDLNCTIEDLVQEIDCK